MPLCDKTFTLEEVTRLKKAIEEYYYFELLCGPPHHHLFMYLFIYWLVDFLLSDDLPVHGFIGTADGEKHYLFTHVQFNVLYNNDKARFVVDGASEVRLIGQLLDDSYRLR